MLDGKLGSVLNKRFVIIRFRQIKAAKIQASLGNISYNENLGLSPMIPFDEEVEKLDRWSNDLKQGLESKIKDLDREIREVKKSASLARSLNNKLEIQKQVKQLEATRKEKRKRLFDAEDEIDNRRDGLISDTERRLQVQESESELFTIRWHLI